MLEKETVKESTRLATRIRKIDNEEGDLTTICIVNASKCARVRVEDIELIEKDGRKLHIYTADREYQIYESLAILARKLVEYDFYRPMSSLVINFAKVREIDDTYIYFDSGRSVMLGFNNVTRAKCAYRRYLMKYPPFMEWDKKLSVAELKAGQVGYECDYNKSQKNEKEC